jgi:transposase
MDFHLDTLLNLPNIVAESYSSTLDAIVVKLQLVNAGINCPNCNDYISQVHQTRSVLVRDLSIFGQVVYLKVPRRLLGETHAVDERKRGVRCTKQWLISAKVMFGSAADTLDSHLEEICNYFNNRTTSGVTEGINTRIKLIVRQSYGFKNFDMMKEKLLACLSP